MKFSLSPENLRTIPRGSLFLVLWDFYMAYAEKVRSDPARRSPHFSAAESREFDVSLPRGLRLVHSVIRFDSDILNGGIRQYVTNHTQRQFGTHAGDEVLEDLEALETIGATESAKILRDAIELYRRYGWPSDPEMRWLDLSPEDEARCEEFGDLRCDDKASGRDHQLLEDYLWQHLDECVLDEEVESWWIEQHIQGSGSDPS
jgi:hypothetical protein